MASVARTAPAPRPDRPAVRRAASGDLDPLAELWWVAWRATYPPLLPSELVALFHKGLLRDQLEAALPATLLAEIGGRLAGFAFRADNLVDNLWVLPSLQRQGVGAALLGRTAAIIADEGYAFARLRCVAANRRARAFYRGQGWREARFPVDLVRGEFEVPMVEYQKGLTLPGPDGLTS
ncbi:MAG TPA: GNAT family N-acetyltransferase [Alphaproteobacteria bacterium]|nr:GNAT family N-acetyltransferase [Alphaproteobacteria bacterium]